MHNNKLDFVDRVHKAIVDDAFDQLSEKDSKRFEVVKDIDRLYSESRGSEEMLKIVKEKHKDLGLPFSRATFYRMLAEAQQIFGPLQKFDKNIYRRVAINQALKTYRKADLRNDAKSMAAATTLR